VKVYVGGGRRMGMRPGDLVGAITAEAGVPGSAIGAIQITDSFSLVDVADEVVEQVVRALRTATIRGRTFAVRLDRDTR
jgi:ATP-dependent RNA helicase DeaD